MTNDKTDAGPERGDGEARGVSPPDPDPSYDLSIHNNPNAMAWAKFFCESHPNCGLDEGAMVGWFASAMMAMHDHILKIGPLNGDHAQFLMDQERREEQGASQDEPRPLPSWARQPMIDSGPVKPRIVHAWHDRGGYLWVLGSDGRMFLRWTDGNWHAPESHPPGLEP